jgi:hypothetical protein
MKQEESNLQITSLVFAPHADSFLGSPFWNAILHRKSEASRFDWRSARFFWWIDALFRLASYFWIRSYKQRKQNRTPE